MKYCAVSNCTSYSSINILGGEKDFVQNLSLRTLFDANFIIRHDNMLEMFSDFLVYICLLQYLHVYYHMIPNVDCFYCMVISKFICTIVIIFHTL